MEKLHKCDILEFAPGTLEQVRKLYNLHEPGRMDEAIDILDLWANQQKHFQKKDFSRDYLETTIINCKGLLERSKSRLDKVCTLRNFSPQFFGDFHAKTDFKRLLTEKVQIGALPRQTNNFERIIFMKNMGDYDTSVYDDYYKYFVYICEYMKAHDYAIGYIYVCDMTELNLAEFAKAFSVTNMRQWMNMMIEGYGVRIKAIHFITNSKLAELVVGLFKSVLSAKVGSRIQVHKSIESVHEQVDKNLLPIEFGGSDFTMKEIHEKWKEVFSKQEWKDYMKEMNKACTDESLRPKGSFNDQYMGMPGTFRQMTVD